MCCTRLACTARRARSQPDQEEPKYKPLLANLFTPEQNMRQKQRQMSKTKRQRKAPHKNCYSGNTIVQRCLRSPSALRSTSKRGFPSAPQAADTHDATCCAPACTTRRVTALTARKDSEFQDTLHTCTMARACKADGKGETPPAWLSRNANARHGPKTNLQGG